MTHERMHIKVEGIQDHKVTVAIVTVAEDEEEES